MIYSLNIQLYNTNSKKPHCTVLDLNYEIRRVKRGENEKRIPWIQLFSIKSVYSLKTSPTCFIMTCFKDVHDPDPYHTFWGYLKIHTSRIWTDL